MSTKYQETPLNSARGRVFGCHGDVPGGTKNMMHTLRVILRLFMITPAIEKTQRGALRYAIHATRRRLQSV